MNKYSVDGCISDRGIDWAYSRLVNKALNGDKHQTRELATAFRPEIWEECVGMACADIDLHKPTHPKQNAYRIVLDVCKELTGR